MAQAVMPDVLTDEQMERLSASMPDVLTEADMQAYESGKMPDVLTDDEIAEFEQPTPEPSPYMRQKWEQAEPDTAPNQPYKPTARMEFVAPEEAIARSQETRPMRGGLDYAEPGAGPRAPEKQTYITEPTVLKPLEFGLGKVMKAGLYGAKTYLSDIARQKAIGLESVTYVPEEQLDEGQKELLDAGRVVAQKMADNDVPVSKLDSDEQLAYRYLRQREAAGGIKKTGENLSQWADDVDKVFPSLKEAAEDAQTIVMSKDTWDAEKFKDPAHSMRVLGALVGVAAEQTPNTAVAATSLIHGVGPAISSMAMIDREAGAWIKQARQYGIDDPQVLDAYSKIYAVPSGLVEVGSTAMILAPVRVVKAILPGAAKQALGAAAKKLIVGKLVAKVVGSKVAQFAGSALLEGAEEMTQAQIEVLVMRAALEDMAKKYPDKADIYRQKIQEIDTNFFSESAVAQGIIGAITGGFLGGGRIGVESAVGKVGSVIEQRKEQKAQRKQQISETVESLIFGEKQKPLIRHAPSVLAGEAAQMTGRAQMPTVEGVEHVGPERQFRVVDEQGRDLVGTLGDVAGRRALEAALRGEGEAVTPEELAGATTDEDLAAAPVSAEAIRQKYGDTIPTRKQVMADFGVKGREEAGSLIKEAYKPQEAPAIQTPPSAPTKPAALGVNPIEADKLGIQRNTEKIETYRKEHGDAATDRLLGPDVDVDDLNEDEIDIVFLANANRGLEKRIKRREGNRARYTSADIFPHVLDVTKDIPDFLWPFVEGVIDDTSKERVATQFRIATSTDPAFSSYEMYTVLPGETLIEKILSGKNTPPKFRAYIESKTGESKAPQKPEAPAQTTPTVTPPAPEAAPQAVPAAPEKKLADFGIKAPSGYWALSEAKRDEVFPQLSAEEQEAVTASAPAAQKPATAPQKPAEAPVATEEAAAEQLPTRKRRSSYAEFQKMTPEQQQEAYEANPVTNRSGQPAFERVFLERTANETRPVVVAFGDINGFAEYNNVLLGEGPTDEQNQIIFDVLEKRLGKGSVKNLHGDEYAVFANEGETPEQFQKRLQEASQGIADEAAFTAHDGKTYRPTMSWTIGTPQDFVSAGKVDPKIAGKNAIAIDRGDKKAYNVVKASNVPDSEIIKRTGKTYEDSLRKSEPAETEGQPARGVEGEVVERGDIQQAERPVEAQPVEAPTGRPSRVSVLPAWHRGFTGIIRDDFLGSRNETPKFTEEFSALDDKEKYVALAKESRAIGDRIAVTPDTHEKFLLGKMRNAIRRQMKHYTEAGVTKTKREGQQQEAEKASAQAEDERRAASPDPRERYDESDFEGIDWSGTEDIRYSVAERTPDLYSPTIRTIEGIKQEKGVVPQIQSMLKKGQLKKAETEWMGLEQFLADNPQATKTDVLDFLREKQVRVDVVEKTTEKGDFRVVLSGNVEHYNTLAEAQEAIDNHNDWIDNEAFSDVQQDDDTIFVSDNESNEIVRFDKNPNGTYSTDMYSYDTFTEEEALEKANEIINSARDNLRQETSTIEDIQREMGIEGGTKFTQYNPFIQKSIALAGGGGGNLGTNPREINLVMPATVATERVVSLSEAEGIIHNGGEVRQADSNAIVSGDVYRVPSAHQYGDEADVNRIAHVRTWDVDYKGDKALAIGEVQSDWALALRKQAEANKPKYETRERETNGREGWSTWDIQNSQWISPDNFARKDLADEITNAKNNVRTSTAIPKMPFERNWDELALKKSILTAANEDYDRIVIANGKQTAALYDLSRQIEQLSWNPRRGAKDGTKTVVIQQPNNDPEIRFDILPDGTISAVGGSNAMPFNKKQLADVIGKDLAEKVLSGGPYGYLAGEGLKIQPQWALNLYNKRILSILRDLIKKNKWNTELEEIDIGAENGPNVSIRITPEMREAVQAEGLPMFQRRTATARPLDRATIDSAIKKLYDANRGTLPFRVVTTYETRPTEPGENLVEPDRTADTEAGDRGEGSLPVEEATKTKAFNALAAGIRSSFGIPGFTADDIREVPLPAEPDMVAIQNALSTLGYSILPVEVRTESGLFNATVLPKLLPKTVIWNADGRADSPVIVTAFHEIGHLNESDMSEFLRIAKEEMSEAGTAYGERKHRGATKISDEVAFDWIGQEAQTEGFWKRMYARSPELVRRIVDYLNRVLNRMLRRGNPGDAWYRDITRVRDAADRAMENVLTRGGGIGHEGMAAQRREPETRKDIAQPQDNSISTLKGGDRSYVKSTPKQRAVLNWLDSKRITRLQGSAGTYVDIKPEELLLDKEDRAKTESLDYLYGLSSYDNLDRNVHFEKGIDFKLLEENARLLTPMRARLSSPRDKVAVGFDVSSPKDLEKKLNDAYQHLEQERLSKIESKRGVIGSTKDFDEKQTLKLRQAVHSELSKISDDVQRGRVEKLLDAGGEGKLIRAARLAKSFGALIDDSLINSIQEVFDIRNAGETGVRLWRDEPTYQIHVLPYDTKNYWLSTAGIHSVSYHPQKGFSGGRSSEETYNLMDGALAHYRGMMNVVQKIGDFVYEEDSVEALIRDVDKKSLAAEEKKIIRDVGLDLGYDSRSPETPDVQFQRRTPGPKEGRQLEAFAEAEKQRPHRFTTDFIPDKMTEDDQALYRAAMDNYDTARMDELKAKYGITDEDIQREIKEREASGMMQKKETRESAALRAKLQAIRSRQVREERGQVAVAFDIVHRQKDEITKLKTEAERNAANEELMKSLRRVVRNYAASVRYKGPLTLTVMEGAKSVRTLENVLTGIDNYVEKQAQRDSVKKLRSILDTYKKRIQRWETGKSKPIDSEHVKALREYIELHDETREPFDIESINRRVMQEEQGQKVEISADERKFKKIYDKVFGETDPESAEANLDLNEKVFLAEAMRPPIEQMNSQQIRDVIANIRSIYKSGKTLRQIELEKQEAEANRRALETTTQIRNSMKELPEPEAPAAVRAVEETAKKRAGKKMTNAIMDVASSMKWGYLRPELIAETFTDNYQMLGMQPGAVSKYVFNPMLRAHETELANRAKSEAWMKENFKDIPRVGLDEPVIETTYVAERDDEGNVTKREPIKISVNNAMFLYANSQNEKNMRHLESTGFDEESVYQATRSLPQANKDAVDRLLDYYDNVQYPRINEVFKAVYGIDMPKEEKYFPILDLDRKNAESAVVMDLLQRYSTARPASVQKGMTKKRVDSGAAYRTLDFFGNVFHNMGSTEHYIAMEKDVNEVRRFMVREDVKKAMREKNEGAYRQMNQWLKDTAAGRIANVPQNFIDQWADFARRNYSVFALGLNPRVWAKQLASIPIGLAYADAPALAVKNAFVLAYEMATHPFQKTDMMTFVQDASAYMAARAKTMEREIAEFFKSAEYGKLFGTGVDMEKIRYGAMKMIQVFDQVAVTMLWKTRFDKVLSTTGNREAAVRAADMLVRRTQPEGAIVNLPGMFRQKGLVAAYTAFMNQVNQHANLLYGLGRGATAKESDKGKVTEIAIGTFATLLVGSTIIYLINNGLWFKKLKDDPEGLAKEFVMGSGVGSFAIANQLASEAMDAAINEVRETTDRPKKRTYGATFGPLIFGTVEATTDATKAFVSMAGSLARGEIPEAVEKGIRGVEKGADAAAGLSGLPLSYPIRAIKGIKRVGEQGPKALVWPESVLREDEGSSAFWRNRIKKAREKGKKEKIPEFEEKMTEALVRERMRRLTLERVKAKKAGNSQRAESIQGSINQLKARLKTR